MQDSRCYEIDALARLAPEVRYVSVTLTWLFIASSPVSLPVRGREEEPGIHRLRMRQILGT